MSPVLLHCIPGMGGGGTERQLSYVAGGLRSLGWDVGVALRTGGPNLARLEAGGVAVHHLGGAGNHDPRILLELLRVIRKVRPDIVHVSLLQMEILGGLAAEMSHLPWVFSERSSTLAYPDTLKNRLRVHMASRADAIIANSTAGDDYWKERVGSGVLRAVVPNAVPIAEIDAAEPVPATVSGVPDDVRLVLFAGRFSPEKNLRILVQALERVAAEQKTVAVLAGDGPERACIAKLIEQRGLAASIRVAGYLDDIWRWMRRADAFVSISRFEGRPNTVIEAMAAGCPLVVSDIPAHTEILDRASARLVKGESVDEVATAIVEVLTKSEDARRRAERARATVEEWSVARVVREYDRVYRRVLTRRLGGQEE